MVIVLNNRLEESISYILSSSKVALSLFSVTKHSDNHILYYKNMSHERNDTFPQGIYPNCWIFSSSSSGIWSHVDAVVNLTNHFMKILPLKTVDKVVLFDSSRPNAIHIGVCYLHLGCKCSLRKRVDQRSALAERLQERRCSILFSPVRDSDEGLGMRVKVHFTDSSRRNLTFRIRLKPKEGK